MKTILKKVSVLMLLTLLGLKISFAQEEKLIVTSVSKLTNDTYEIVLNDIIVIKDVKLKKTKIGQREIVNLQFPEYISKRGKVFPQVVVLSKDLTDRITSAIITSKVEQLPSAVEPSYKLNKFSPFRREGSSLKIFASVIFAGTLEVECKVMEGKRGPWIAWPSVKDESTGKYRKQVVFKSREYQKKIENDLLSKYKTSSSESGSGDDDY
ncbi:MAG: septation protein SpoVG family protein [Endomicrobiia bacterium]